MGLSAHRRTDGRTDGRTHKVKTVCPPLSLRSLGGHNNQMMGQFWNTGFRWDSWLDNGPDEDSWAIGSQWDKPKQLSNFKFNVSDILYIKIAQSFACACYLLLNGSTRDGAIWHADAYRRSAGPLLFFMSIGVIVGKKIKLLGHCATRLLLWLNCRCSLYIDLDLGRVGWMAGTAVVQDDGRRPTVLPTLTPARPPSQH